MAPRPGTKRPDVAAKNRTNPKKVKIIGEVPETPSMFQSVTKYVQDTEWLDNDHPLAVGAIRAAALADATPLNVSFQNQARLATQALIQHVHEFTPAAVDDSFDEFLASLSVPTKTESA